MVRYKGDTLMPPQGDDAIKWVGTLTPAFLATQPKPGSYQ